MQMELKFRSSIKPPPPEPSNGDGSCEVLPKRELSPACAAERLQGRALAD